MNASDANIRNGQDVMHKSALIVGYGSIGARHARIASEMGNRSVVVSRRPIENLSTVYTTISDTLAAEQIDYAIVANETASHLTSLMELRACGFDGPILIEKPLAATLPQDWDRKALIPDNIYVAYNLRFHPALRKLKERVQASRLVNVTIYAGQDLRSWRAGRGAEDSYSARRADGGGVLRDLSHELDYFGWIFGRWTRLAAMGGHHGPLPIDADDCWSILVETEQCPVASIQIDYYHQPGARRIIVNTTEETLAVDLVQHSYSDSDGEIFWPIERDMTYRAQLEALTTGREAQVLCTFDEGLETMVMIEAIERAAARGIWVAR